MSFQEKYLKYKKKYLSAKNQVNKMIKNQVGGMFHCPRCGNNFNTIQLTIKNMAGDMLHIDIEPSATILDLKKAINAENQAYPVQRQKLFFQNPAYIAEEPSTHRNPAAITLDNHRRIRDYVIPNNEINILIDEVQEAKPFMGFALGADEEDEVKYRQKYFKNQVGGALYCTRCGFTFTTINITIRTIPNNFNIDISPETTIIKLKEAIFSEHPNYPVELQRLYIDRPGAPDAPDAVADLSFPIILENNLKYSDYPIQNNTIKLFLEDKAVYNMIQAANKRVIGSSYMGFSDEDEIKYK